MKKPRQKLSESRYPSRRCRAHRASWGCVWLACLALLVLPTDAHAQTDGPDTAEPEAIEDDLFADDVLEDGDDPFGEESSTEEDAFAAESEPAPKASIFDWPAPLSSTFQSPPSA